MPIILQFMKLLVDNREPKELISILTNRFKNVELGNLELGDFIIKNDDHNQYFH